MTLAQCRRLEPGQFVFYDRTIYRVASPSLVRRRTGTHVRIEVASGAPGPTLEVLPGTLRPFGKLRRASAANRLLAGHLRRLVHRL